MLAQTKTNSEWIKPHTILTSQQLLLIQELSRQGFDAAQIVAKTRRTPEEVQQVLADMASYRRADRLLAVNAELTAVECDLIVKLHQQGLDVVTIARNLSLPKSMVVQHLIKLKLITPAVANPEARYLSPEEREQLVDEFLAGESARKLAVKYSRHRKTIMYIVKQVLAKRKVDLTTV